MNKVVSAQTCFFTFQSVNKTHHSGWLLQCCYIYNFTHRSSSFSAFQAACLPHYHIDTSPSMAMDTVIIITNFIWWNMCCVRIAPFARLHLSTRATPETYGQLSANTILIASNWQQKLKSELTPTHQKRSNLPVGMVGTRDRKRSLSWFLQPQEFPERLSFTPTWSGQFQVSSPVSTDEKSSFLHLKHEMGWNGFLWQRSVNRTIGW